MAAEPTPAKERVLVIDDDPQILVLLGRILRGAGYRCVCASDVEQARTSLASAPFDLMLCDVQLGDHSGLDLVEHVLAIHPHTAAVMGRIAAVADVYDALTRDRVYRPRFSQSDALLIMEEGRGTHFDPEVLDALLTVLERTHGIAAKESGGDHLMSG